MTIHYDEERRIFHVQAKGTSYVMAVSSEGTLLHLYWGQEIQDAGALLGLLQIHRGSPTGPVQPPNADVGTWPHEFPAFGMGDHRSPAYVVQRFDGSIASCLTYVGHRIVPGKPKLPGLPATYVESDEEAETLEIELLDPVLRLRVILRYTAFAQHSAIARSATFINNSDESFQLQRALSASIDMAGADYAFLQLSGAWIRERFVELRQLVPGEQSVYSRSGMSGHKHNPFIALVAPRADEEHGDVYGFSLVYSGNFLAKAEVEPMRQSVRVQIGIHPDDFSWLLEPGASFQSPEAVLVYSDRGIGEMSRTYHRLYRTRLARGRYRDEPRPVLVNNWEATYFNFDADKLVEIAKAGSELGVELFVLDDGWFGKRDSDNCSLGDWYPDPRKLPGGLADVAKRVEACGMQFGIWMEPEMVSPDSDLYRQHPDWCLHVAERPRSERRNQLTLDLSRPDVCDFIVEAVSNVLHSAPIRYVKWDMNRPMTEVGSATLPPERQRETAHRYMLGLYDVLERITTAFPDVLFESCASGGGRFDPGMLYYMPQTWTSDNTDAVSRLKIQYGTSIVYPASSMGAHVSAVPNHQMHRLTPLSFRGHVAMSGNFGYELDLSRFTAEERELAKQQVAAYKSIRSLVQFGDFYRLLSPFEGNETAWMFVSAQQDEAYMAYFRVFPDPLQPVRRLRLRGLRESTYYRIEETGEVYLGELLMRVGMNMPLMDGDYQSVTMRLRKV
ncbi:alpha-galactosidase [Alicyclobacillus hesperidum]|uniref:Alpha-galactosidase n=1 Tax=Alicyclobacillus hesperidum TaxID=89784 RepID=A0AA37U2N1_9BACL|nr:alpha-galactosidase [Alicyclobacillus hesperidum]GLV14426.1 alpha-galactosidase [Alicyclobacillus hesperidum]